jgi:hypothetical protein
MGRQHVIGEQLHQFDSYKGKSWIGVLVDFQAKLSGKPELRQKVRHGLDAVHGNAAEFDPGCPKQLAIVPENPQHGFGVVRRMRGSGHVRICLFTAAPGSEDSPTGSTVTASSTAVSTTGTN